VIAVGLLGAAFPLARTVTAADSARGCPRLTGAESWRSEGNPTGRSNGKSSNTPPTRACTPNDVKVVNPRRERSSHDELSVLVNMVSSCWNAVTVKDTKGIAVGWAEAKKKGRAWTRPLGTFTTHAVSRKTTSV
jgi:hypothetical protein